MPDEAAARPNLQSALRKTAVTALLAFGLFLPLIGFNTVQNIRNELVLELRDVSAWYPVDYRHFRLTH